MGSSTIPGDERFLVLPGLTTTSGSAGSGVYEIWYEGERLYPPVPQLPAREVPLSITVMDQDARDELLGNRGYPRNRAERRAYEAQKRKRKR